MSASSTDLPIGKPLLWLLLFGMAILVLVLVLYQFDKQQKQRIHQQYAEETESYITNNQDKLRTLLLDTFPQSDQLLSKDQNYNQVVMQRKQNMSKLSLPPDLKDFSSTMFVKRSQDGRILQMTLSADVSELFPYNQEHNNDLIKLLNGQTRELPLADYIYQFSGPEVVVPVYDNGIVIGAIARRVIR